MVCGQISGDRQQEMTKDASFSNVAPRICQDFRKQRIDDETIFYDNWKVCLVVKNVRLSLLRLFSNQMTHLHRESERLIIWSFR